jgi:hypothetical protein
MLGGIIGKLKLANLARLVADGSLRCPECGCRARSAPDAGRDVVRCESCGKESLVDEWILTGKDAKLIGDADEPPPETEIVREEDAGEVVWRIPAAGKSGCLLVFGIFWCVFTFGHGAFIIPAVFSSTVNGEVLRWVIVPFYFVFWAVGIGMVYVGLRNRFAKHVLRSDGETISLAREMFGRRKEARIRCDEVRSIAQKEFYQENYQPVYGIEIRTAVKKLRFGTMLSIGERAWLVADLRRVAGKDESRPFVPAEAERAIATGRVSSFSFPLPMAWKSATGFAIILSLMGAGFVAVGVFLLGGDEAHGGYGNDFSGMVDLFFDVIAWLFRIVWTAIALAMTTGGVMLPWKAFRSSREEVRLEGSDSEVAVRTMRHGLVCRERSFPRHAVTDIRSVLFMAGGPVAAKRIELIVDGKAERVALCVEASAADSVVAQVRAALGV